MQSVPVLLPYPFPGPFDYEQPDGMDLSPGDLVLVPLNKSQTVGVVWALPQPAGDHALKPVTERLDLPPMTEPLRKLVDWVASYYMARPGSVLAMALRIDLRAAPAERIAYRATPNFTGKLTPQRQKLLSHLAAHPQTAAALARAAGVGTGVIKSLAAIGAITPISAPLFTHPNPEHPGPTLSAAQASAASALRTLVTAREFSVTLLQGVTGSGKTETYFEAIAECLRQNRQALILLPEIALSSQWLSRFARRFGVEPAVWHSDLTPARRRDTWHAVAGGEAPVLVGARSALFLPFPDLGLIVVDEEHETSFKQEEGVNYHARDAAVVRARFEAAPIVLVSATPSLETVTNVEWGRYGHLDLPDRHAGASLPQIAPIDLREFPPERGLFLSQPIIDAVHATLARGEQAMLFLNRRGYAPLTLCRHCGHRMQCKNCTAWLVEHRGRKSLICHHCGHTVPRPQKCPACDAEDSLAAIGPGVERIAEEAAALFPESRRLIMASDMISSAREAARAVAAIEAREIDLIIGTQMVAKGWHFRRAHPPTPPSGFRPSRSRGSPRPSPAPDLQPRPSSNACPDRRRFRRLHGLRSANPPSRPLAPLWPPGRDHHQQRAGARSRPGRQPPSPRRTPSPQHRRPGPRARAPIVTTRPPPPAPIIKSHPRHLSTKPTARLASPSPDPPRRARRHRHRSGVVPLGSVFFEKKQQKTS